MAGQQVGDGRAALSQGTGDDTGRTEVLHVLEVDTRCPHGHERRLVENDMRHVHWGIADSRRELLAVSSNPSFLLTACSCTLPLQRQQVR